MIACPACGEDTCVKETRSTWGAARRRRTCVNCGKKVTTIEVIVRSPTVTKKIIKISNQDRDNDK